MKDNRDPFPTTPDADLWEGELGKFDAPENDMHVNREQESIGVEDEPRAPHDETFVMHTPGDILDALHTEWLIEEVAATRYIVVLVGESGGSKTFVALDLAVCIAAGQHWHGRRVEPGGVLVLLAEGDAIGPRFRAACAGLGLTPAQARELPIVFVRESAILSPVTDRYGTQQDSIDLIRLKATVRAFREQLEARGIRLRLIIVDTLRATLAGSEDASDNIAGYVNALRAVLADEAPDACAIVTHHSGWGDNEQRTTKRRERGSSAIRGNSDCVLLLEKNGDLGNGEQRLILSTLKCRDGSAEPRLALRRLTVEVTDDAGNVMRDNYGRTVTSCMVRNDDGPTPEQDRHDDRERREAARLDAFMVEIANSLRSHNVKTNSELCSLLHGRTTEKKQAIAFARVHNFIQGGYGTLLAWTSTSC
jgi:hypothetical protein